MTTKHTAGPWHVVANDAYLSGKTPLNMVSVYAGQDRREHVVCNSCDPADAQLIAQSPAMLKQLGILAEAMRAQLDPEHCAHGAIDWKDLLLHTQDIIQKATGVQS